MSHPIQDAIRVACDLITREVNFWDDITSRRISKGKTLAPGVQACRDLQATVRDILADADDKNLTAQTNIVGLLLDALGDISINLKKAHLPEIYEATERALHANIEEATR